MSKFSQSLRLCLHSTYGGCHGWMYHFTITAVSHIKIIIVFDYAAELMAKAFYFVAHLDETPS